MITFAHWNLRAFLQSFKSDLQTVLEKNKYVIYLPRSVRIGKTVPSVLITELPAGK